MHNNDISDMTEAFRPDDIADLLPESAIKSHFLPWDTPTKIYLRLWPHEVHVGQYNASLRWQDRIQGSRDLQVQINRHKSRLNFTEQHNRLWEEAQANLVLDHIYDLSMWAGMARRPEGNWDQDHIFLLFQNRYSHNFVHVISQHYGLLSTKIKQDNRQQFTDWKITL